MTIHSAWAQVFKQRNPRCCEPTLPPPDGANAPKCGIIDGHIQLMGAYYTPTWDVFLQNQFLRPVNQLFNYGCTTVVLLFDDRQSVSPYKSMTQHKRSKRCPDVCFSQSDTLPKIPPSPWIDYMMNRHFKDKVISFVCENIQRIVQPHPQRALIVDFKSPPKLYMSPSSCPLDVPGLVQLGESDVKFARYVHLFGNSIVHATDGDYIAIMLLYYSRHGVSDSNNVFLYRQVAVVPDAPTKTRRGRGQPASAVAATDQTKKKRTKRRMEYMNMHLVFRTVCAMMGRTAAPFAEQQRVLVAFVSAMLLMGTDYNRGIPLIGPKRFIDILPAVARDMTEICTRHEDGEIVPVASKLGTALVNPAYKTVFVRFLARTFSRSLEQTVTALKKSALAPRMREMLPTMEQLYATCANVCWVVHYWKDCINAPPDMSQCTAYGFHQVGPRQFTWTDLAPVPPETEEVIDVDRPPCPPDGPFPRHMATQEQQYHALESARAFLCQYTHAA